MARIDNKGKLHGIVGTTLVREIGGKQFIQFKGTKRKMNSKSLDNFNEFKIASSSGKIIRDNIQNILDQHHDINLYRRFTGALHSAMISNQQLEKGQRNLLNCSMESLQGFEFNITHPFSKTFYVKIKTEVTEDNQLHITVPSFIPRKFVKFPGYTKNACLKFSLYSHDLKSPVHIPLPNYTIDFSDLNQEVEEHHFSFDIPQEEYFTIVFAELIFYSTTEQGEMRMYNSKQFHPSMIVFGK